MNSKFGEIITVALGFLLVFSMISIAGNDDKEYTFRNTKWGMSKSEVIEQQGPPREVTAWGSQGYEEVVLYIVNVAGLDAYMYYAFTNEKLVTAGYYFVNYYSGFGLDDFRKVEKILTEKYGKPEYEKVWQDDRYKGNPSKLERAIGLGDLDYGAKWETDKTKIIERMYEEDDTLSFDVWYISKKYSDLIENTKEEQTQRQF